MSKEVQTMTCDVLRQLKVGDFLVTPGIFKGITKEECYWEVISNHQEVIVFAVTYMGRTVARFLGKYGGDKIKWEGLPC
jgi:hypothetical protein